MTTLKIPQALRDAEAAAPDIRIDLDPDGSVDDVAIANVTMFRMERMSDGHFWIRLHREGGEDFVFRLTSRGKIRCEQEGA